MKEAKIIFPVEGPLNTAMSDCIHAVTNAFGGATITDGTGHWRHPNGEYILETVRIATIAYEPNTANDCKLYDIAHRFLTDARQIEVYLRYGNGTVQMVTERSCMDNGENLAFDWETFREELHRLADDPNDIPEEHHGAVLESSMVPPL